MRWMSIIGLWRNLEMLPLKRIYTPAARNASPLRTPASAWSSSNTLSSTCATLNLPSPNWAGSAQNFLRRLLGCALYSHYPGDAAKTLFRLTRRIAGDTRHPFLADAMGGEYYGGGRKAGIRDLGLGISKLRTICILREAYSKERCSKTKV